MSEKLSSALQDTDQIDITVTGRVSGRQISLPVWFVADDGKVQLVPVKGSGTDWYKNVRATPDLQLTARGASMTATATPVTEPARVREIVEKFRSKYGADQIAAYYPKTDVAVDVSLPDETS